MSAEVSSMQFGAIKAREKSSSLITRDLLGGCGLDSTELELDSHVPYGWEKRLDLQSGNVYLQRCNSPATSSDHQLSDTNLDLKLVSSSSSPEPSSSLTSYQSVCTLDKVKSALERAEREKLKKRTHSKEVEKNWDEKFSPASFATGCPNCLLYVLVSAKNPKCPRCNTTISSSFGLKKPRIDLNISM